MRLDDLIRGLKGVHLDGAPETDVTSTALDSRAVRPGALFAALRGEKLDGLKFVPGAIENGAVAILSERERPSTLPREISWLQSQEPRMALATLARRLAGAPDERLAVIGITGTNGKTTTSYLLAAALEAAGLPSAIGGTIGLSFRELFVDTSLTTPEAPALWSFLAAAEHSGACAAALEVTSAALVAGRVDELLLRGAVLTNIGHDHLDTHGSFEAYRGAKRRLFQMLPPQGFSVLPRDDRFFDEFRAVAPGRLLSFGYHADADWRIEGHRADSSGARFRLTGATFEREIHWHRPGRWDALNLAAALACCEGLGLDLDRALEGALALETVPGRFQAVQCGQPFRALVDYAHTPDALEQTLELVRATTPGRVIVAFGCGGDRDRTKRPRMGEIAARLSDRVIVTDDNPRSEDPEAIAAEIIAGIGGGASVVRVSPRRDAIELSVSEAAAGDTVLIVGKGHERYQEIAGKRTPFDDVAELRSAIEARLG